MNTQLQKGLGRTAVSASRGSVRKPAETADLGEFATPADRLRQQAEAAMKGLEAAVQVARGRMNAAAEKLERSERKLGESKGKVGRLESEAGEAGRRYEVA